ncbi:MAG TPA: hypothetical protein VMT62_17675 [Syntrophorhabdaceae bacterium]|nr:hypothetical protein [Syntrophorhabdaceae bacterium]
MKRSFAVVIILIVVFCCSATYSFAENTVQPSSKYSVKVFRNGKEIIANATGTYETKEIAGDTTTFVISPPVEATEIAIDWTYSFRGRMVQRSVKEPFKSTASDAQTTIIMHGPVVPNSQSKMTGRISIKLKGGEEIPLTLTVGE